jgi:hypothetical protein
VGKIGRNDRCPCGSGEKYKRCCIDRKLGDAAVPRGRERPTPVEAIAAKRADFAQRLQARDDTYAQLVGKGFAHEQVGMDLRSTLALTDDERAELRALAPAALAAYQHEMQEVTDRLRELVAQGHPLHVLSSIVMANLMAPPGAYYEPTHHGFESFVELVGGLLLTQPPPTAREPASAEVLSAIHEQMAALQDLIVLRNLAAQQDEAPETGGLRFSGVLQWTTVRGTSFEHHRADLARAIYGPFDAWCLKRYGFTAEDVLRVGAAADQWSTDRFNELLQEAHAFADRIQATMSDTTLRAALSAEELARLDAPGMSESVRFRAFTEVISEGISDASAFCVDDLVGDDLPRERVEAVLNELSVSVGGLEASEYRGLFDRSPLVERPFVEFEGRYLLPIPGMVLRDTVGLLENRLVNGGPRSFSTSRAKTLDALAVDYLVALLPSGRGFVNLFYEGTELDGLVIFERTAFVVEGKGTPLSAAAQRGDLERLRRDVERAVEEAWTQGKRARDYILGEDAPAVFVDDSGTELVRLEPGQIDEVVILNPTIHQLAGHASQLPRLRILGLFADGEYPWSVFINDLRVIAETADNAAVFLHYLIWRGRLPLGEQVTAADELDLWASYLLSERFGSLADGGHYLVGNATTDFDAYYNGLLGNGPPAPKPRKMLEEPVKSFVERMADERPPGWRRAAGTCLDLSILEMAYVCGRAPAICDTAQQHRRTGFEEVGRVRLVRVPRGDALEQVITDAEDISGEATFHIYMQAADDGAPQVIEAKTVGPVTFELSGYEKRCLQELAREQQP